MLLGYTRLLFESWENNVVDTSRYWNVETDLPGNRCPLASEAPAASEFLPWAPGWVSRWHLRWRRLCIRFVLLYLHTCKWMCTKLLLHGHNWELNNSIFLQQRVLSYPKEYLKKLNFCKFNFFTASTHLHVIHIAIPWKKKNVQLTSAWTGSRRNWCQPDWWQRSWRFWNCHPSFLAAATLAPSPCKVWNPPSSSSWWPVSKVNQFHQKWNWFCNVGFN